MTDDANRTRTLRESRTTLAEWLTVLAALVYFYVLWDALVFLGGVDLTEFFWSAASRDLPRYLHLVLFVQIVLIFGYVALKILRIPAFRDRGAILLAALIALALTQTNLAERLTGAQTGNLFFAVRLGAGFAFLGALIFLALALFDEDPPPGASRSAGLTPTLWAWAALIALYLQIIEGEILLNEVLSYPRAVIGFIHGLFGSVGFVCLIALWVQALKLPLPFRTRLLIRAAGLIYAAQYGLGLVVGVNAAQPASVLTHVATAGLLFALEAAILHDLRYGVREDPRVIAERFKRYLATAHEPTI